MNANMSNRDDGGAMDRKSGSRILVWIVLVIAAAACFWVAENTRSLKKLRAELNEVTDQLARVNSSIERMASRTAVEKMHTDVAMLWEELARVEEGMVGPKKTGGKTSDDTATDMTDMIADMMETLAAGRENDDGTGLDLGSFGFDMFTGEQGRKIAEYSARMAMDMQYGDFFAEVELDPEVEQEVRDIIVAHMTDQMTSGIEMATSSEDSTFDLWGIEDMTDQVSEALRADLAQVLTADQMNVWEEYDARKEERVLTKQYDMELGMFASGLTPENRELATDVLVDEILLAKETRQQDPDEPAGMQAEFERQRQVFANARARLAELIDESQLVHFDRFVEQQETAIEFMGLLMGEGESEGEGE